MAESGRKPRRRRAARRWVWLGLLAAGCSASSGGGPRAAERPPAPVSVATAAVRDVPILLRNFGTVEAYNTVAVKSLVGGQIQKVQFREGQSVKAGQTLFVIDPRPYQAMVAQLEANLARDRVQADYAARDAKRVAEMTAKGAGSQDELDKADSTAASAQATVQADQAALDNARLQLSYCTIASPVDGVVGKVLIDLGNVVKANDLPLVTINQVQPIHVSFAVPEQYLPEIRRHQAAQPLAVTARVPGQPAPERGKLAFINNTVDAATGTITLRAVFDNAAERLWPGQFVNVVLTLSVRAHAVVIPSRAIETGQQGQYVFVVEGDSTVRAQPVVPGEALNDETVVSKGLSGGETVVTDGQLRLAPGARVAVRSSPAATAPAPRAEGED